MVSMRLDEWYAKDAAKGKGKGKMDDDEKKAGREAAAPGVGGKLKKSAESLKKALGSSSGDRGSAKEKPKPSASSGIAPNRAPPKPKPKGSPATPPAPRKKKPQKKVDLRAVDLQTRLSGRGTRPGETKGWEKFASSVTKAAAPSSDGDVLPFLRCAEGVIRSKIDRENELQKDLCQRRKQKIRSTFDLLRSVLTAREEDLVAEADDAKDQAAMDLFTAQKAALTLLDPAVHLCLRAHQDPGLLTGLASGLNSLRVSPDAHQDIGSIDDTGVMGTLIEAIGKFGDIGTPERSDGVDATLASVAKLLAPVEAVAARSRRGHGSHSKSGGPIGMACDVMSISSDQSDQSMASGEDAPHHQSRGKWSKRAKAAVNNADWSQV